MKFREILLEYLYEQVEAPPVDDDVEDQEQDDDGVNDENDGVNDDEGFDFDFDPNDPDLKHDEFGNILLPITDDEGNVRDYKKINPYNPKNPPLDKPKKVKPLSPVQLVKKKWKEEWDALADADMNQAIEFFNRKKNGLRAYNPSPAAELPNIPVISAMRMTFPDFPATNEQKVKDIQTYTWKQMEFFIDFYSQEEAVIDADFEIQGDTEELRERSAISKWHNQYTKIVDKDGLIVHRVTSQNESMALGRYQHILVGKFGGNRWCITRIPGDGGTNLYTTYRNERAYYFCLNQNLPVDNIMRVFVFQPAPGDQRFAVTSRTNSGSVTGEKTGLTWEQAVSFANCPQLNEHKEIFKYFKHTENERKDIRFESITFTNPNDPMYFFNQRKGVRVGYVESGRAINYPKIFEALPEEIQKDYVNRTNFDNYKERYVSYDPNDLFGMLRVLGPQNIKFLESILKMRFNPPIPAGIGAIKKAIMEKTLTPSYVKSTDENIRMFRSRDDENLYGIFNLASMLGPEIVKEVRYQRGAIELIRYQNLTCALIKFTHVDSGDYFYIFAPQTNLFGAGRSLRCNIITGRQGDEASAKYPHI